MGGSHQVGSASGVGSVGSGGLCMAKAETKTESRITHGIRGKKTPLDIYISNSVIRKEMLIRNEIITL